MERQGKILHTIKEKHSGLIFSFHSKESRIHSFKDVFFFYLFTNKSRIFIFSFYSIFFLNIKILLFHIYHFLTYFECFFFTFFLHIFNIYSLFSSKENYYYLNYQFMFHLLFIFFSKFH